MFTYKHDYNVLAIFYANVIGSTEMKKMVWGSFYEQRKYICGPLKSSFIITETYNARLRINPRNSLY